MKIAIIVQRYGIQVNGGAEVHARMVAEKLQGTNNVTVLTSRALDYHTWDPVLPGGESVENGIKIIRFNNETRNQRQQEIAYKKIKKTPFVYFRYKVLKWFKYWIPFKDNTNFLDHNNIAWLKHQGPEMPELIDYIKSAYDDYDVFVFFTSLYYPAALGIMAAPGKSILVPEMHNETASIFPVYQKVMGSARWILYNTVSEKKFSETVFPVKATKNAIVAVGIDIPEASSGAPAILEKFRITKPYLIYVGRVDRAKNCDEMIGYFMKYIAQTNAPIQLVLVGKCVIDLPAHPAIIQTGFISDAEKTSLMQKATALIMPSRFESLSLVLLESFACKVPVIANGNTEVLKDHIVQSNGGWFYNSYSGFKNGVDDLLANGQNAREKGKNGFDYVLANYTWPEVISKYQTAFDDIQRQNSGL